MARNGMVEPASDTPVLHAPWDFETTELSEGMCSTVYDARGMMVADYLTEDRARLIAAAPELLSALVELHLKAVIGTDAERHSALDAAWRAIAKATAPSPTPHTRPDDQSGEGNHGSE